MMTVVRLIENGKDVGYRVYCKGASEIVLARCDYLIGADGNPHSFTSERLKEINATVISQMANNGLRTICVAFKNFIRIDAREALKGEVCYLSFIFSQPFRYRSKKTTKSTGTTKRRCTRTLSVSRSVESKTRYEMRCQQLSRNVAKPASLSEWFTKIF